MADLEQRVEKLENKFPTLEQRVNDVITKIDLFIEESRAARERRDAEMREFREKHDADMREFREKHDADMREMRAKSDADMREMRTKHDDDMRAIRQSVEDMGKNTRNMTIAVVIGIAAMVIAVLLK